MFSGSVIGCDVIAEQYELDGLRTDKNKLSKEIGRLKIVSLFSYFFSMSLGFDMFM